MKSPQTAPQVGFFSIWRERSVSFCIGTARPDRIPSMQSGRPRPLLCSRTHSSHRRARNRGDARGGAHLRPRVGQPATVARYLSCSGALRLARSSPRTCVSPSRLASGDATCSVVRTEPTPLGGAFTHGLGRRRQTQSGLRTIRIPVGTLTTRRSVLRTLLAGRGVVPSRTAAGGHEGDDCDGADGQKAECCGNEIVCRPAVSMEYGRFCQEVVRGSRRGGKALETARDIRRPRASIARKSCLESAGAGWCRGHSVPRRADGGAKPLADEATSERGDFYSNKLKGVKLFRPKCAFWCGVSAACGARGGPSDGPGVATKRRRM